MQQIGHELMFPVYRLLKGPGGNAIYDIIGWVGYVITSYTVNGNEGTHLRLVHAGTWSTASQTKTAEMVGPRGSESTRSS